AARAIYFVFIYRRYPGVFELNLRIPQRSRTIRVVELSSSSTTSVRERRKSLKDLKPKDFSLNDGSIRFIWALTAELCSQSTSSFSVPIRSARISKAVAAGYGSGAACGSTPSDLARRVLGAGSGTGTPGSAS